MPLPRFHKLPKEKRRALLDAAAAEFAEHGFEGSSFNRIIADAGVSKGAMYYYFADKADAYAAVLDDVLDQVEELARGLEPPTDSESFWRVMQEGTDLLNEAFVTDEQMAQLARGLYQSHVVDAAYAHLVDRSRGWMRALLELGQRLEAVRTDVSLDLMVEAVTGMLVAVDRWGTSQTELTPEELVEISPQILTLTRDMLEPR